MIIDCPAEAEDYPWDSEAHNTLPTSIPRLRPSIQPCHGISRSYASSAIEISVFGKAFPSGDRYSILFDNVLDSNLRSTIDYRIFGPQPEIVSAQ